MSKCPATLGSRCARVVKQDAYDWEDREDHEKRQIRVSKSLIETWFMIPTDWAQHKVYSSRRGKKEKEKHSWQRNPFWLLVNFLVEILQARIEWNNKFKVLEKKKKPTKNTLSTANLSFKYEGGIKTFLGGGQGGRELRELITITPALKEILKVVQAEMKIH